MRQEEHGLEEQVYCICRSSDASRFMMQVLLLVFFSQMATNCLSLIVDVIIVKNGTMVTALTLLRKNPASSKSSFVQ